MHANSPLEELEYKGERVALPRPRHAVGTRVKPLPQQPDYDYYRAKMLRELLRDTRRVVDKMRRQGYIADKPGQRLPEHNKNMIRQAMHIYDHSVDVEVAGICPRYGHVIGSPANQCYLQSGNCHGGVAYTYYLLFRMELSGDKVALIHAHPIAGEGRLQVL